MPPRGIRPHPSPAARSSFRNQMTMDFHFDAIQEQRAPHDAVFHWECMDRNTVPHAPREKIMAVNGAPPRPDLAAHREALSLAWPEIVRRLTEILGLKLTAYIAGEDDVRALDRWINGTKPHRDVEERLHCLSSGAYTEPTRLAPGSSSMVGGGQSRAWRSRPARGKRRQHRSGNPGSRQSLHSRGLT